MRSPRFRTRRRTGSSLRQPPARPLVVASDLDGTLLRPDGTLDGRSRRALAAVQDAGALLVLCTARPPRWLHPIARTIGHQGLAVCSNGGALWDLRRESVLATVALEPDVLREVVERLREALPGGSWAVERADGFCHEPTYEPRWPVPDGTIVGAVDTLIGRPAIKLLLRHNTMSADALLERARSVVGGLAELSHSNSSDALLEIAARGVSKATALAQLCEERGIGREAVVAFGDMPNDLPMLAWAGYAVAVANAHPDVLAGADEITAGNDDAGVARVLERLFDKRRPTL
jgi:hydroxymethylpyrimidine pyrophosphatase-like HAD family hydrolase